MALSDSATAQRWETFCAGGGAGLVREAVELVLQELIEAEAAEAIGAGRYERSERRVTDRNGHRPRLLATQAGDVELKIPKLRRGSFFARLLTVLAKPQTLEECGLKGRFPCVWIVHLRQVRSPVVEVVGYGPEVHAAVWLAGDSDLAESSGV